MPNSAQLVKGSFLEIFTMSSNRIFIEGIDTK